MQRCKRAIALSALLLSLFASGAHAEEIVGDFTDATTAQGWALTSELYWMATPGAERTPPSMNGSGWLTMMAHAPTLTQMAYATSPTLLDTRVPIRIQYEFLSYNTRKNIGPNAGFHLLDPTKGPELHKDGKALDCASSALMVNMGHEGSYYDVCNGPFEFWEKFNRVVVRADNTVVARDQAPMWLTCGNYDTWHGDRIEARHCTTREEAVARGFVRTVDALVTPALGGGYTLDMKIDGKPIYTQLAIAKPLPPLVQFGLWGDHNSRPHHEVRNVRVTQDGRLTSAVNGHCVEVAGSIAPGRHLAAYACHGRTNQTFRFANERLEAGTLCLGAEHGQNKDGARVITYACNDQAYQRWERTESGQLRSKMAGTQRCITLGATGNHLSLQPCEPLLAAQQFAVRGAP
jgi:hypothetical protein